jgi:[ribosomal protein S18]-alanine N-acetyltransferase
VSETRLHLRPMEASDLASAIEVDTLCLPRPWSEAIWREEIKSPFTLYLLLEEEDEILAQIGVRYLADELHVTTLAVRPEHRRRGYAHVLLEAALGAFPEARCVHLEVRPSNVPARSLYESLGFVTTGRRRRYYGDEDALLMTRYLPARR